MFIYTPMLDFLLLLLRIRTIIILAIIYFFLNISSHGKFTLQLPNFQNISVANLTSGLQNVKKQITDLLGGKDSTNKGSNDTLRQVKKNVSNLLNSDKKKD